MAMSNACFVSKCELSNLIKFAGRPRIASARALFYAAIDGFLVCLRQIVRFPILPVSYFLRYLNRLGSGNGGQVAVSDRADTAFTFNDDFNGVNMLAAFAPFLEIWTRATRRIWIRINFIKRRVIAGGWNAPDFAVLRNACLCCD